MTCFFFSPDKVQEEIMNGELITKTFQKVCVTKCSLLSVILVLDFKTTSSSWCNKSKFFNLTGLNF